MIWLKISGLLALTLATCMIMSFKKWSTQNFLRISRFLYGRIDKEIPVINPIYWDESQAQDYKIGVVSCWQWSGWKFVNERWQWKEETTLRMYQCTERKSKQKQLSFHNNCTDVPKCKTTDVYCCDETGKIGPVVKLGIDTFADIVGENGYAHYVWEKPGKISCYQVNLRVSLRVKKSLVLFDGCRWVLSLSKY